MRIIVVQPWISYRGSETVSVLQTHYLSTLGRHVSLACLYIDSAYAPPHSDEISYILPPRFLQRLVKIPGMVYLFSVPILIFLLFTNRSQYDVILAHNYPSLWVGAVINIIFRKRLVWYVHGVSPEAGLPRNRLMHALWNIGVCRIDQWSAMRCDLIIAVSEKVKRQIASRYRVTAEVLYPPVELSSFFKSNGTAIRKKLSIDPQTKLIVQVSDYIAEKGAFLTVRAFEMLQKEYPNSKLLFVGVRDSDPKAQDSIIFHQFVNPHEIKNYVAAADVVIAPSWKSEGCSVTPLQAALVGTPSVVVTDSGVDELFNRFKLGIVANPNARSLAEGIRSLLDNPIRVSTRKLKNIIDPNTHAVKLSKLLESVVHT